jgi:predicted dehydrogenase
MNEPYEGLRVGVIGCGQIMQFAHLPIYQRLGIRVVWAYDVDSVQRDAVIERCPGARAADSYRAIADAPDIDFVDVAIPPLAQEEVTVACLDGGKHVLCQKPLARNAFDADKIARHARTRDRHVVVNHQMRWSPLIRHTANLVNSGEFGQLIYGNFNLIRFGVVAPSHWISREPRLTCLFNTIHLIDSCRFLFGEPELVRGFVETEASRNIAGDVSVALVLRFTSGAMISITDRLTNRPQPIKADVVLEGTDGVVYGRIGLWDNYPHPSPDVVWFHGVSRAMPLLLGDQECWMPDAFVGPISEIAAVIRHGVLPTVTADEAVRTLKVVDAIYASSEAGGRVLAI